MRICVLADDDLKEFNPGQYLVDYSWEMFVPQVPIINFVRALEQNDRFEVYFNLCDGSDDKDQLYSGLDIIHTLETLNVPFTGADSRFYNPTREEMQAIAESVGVRFARGFNVTNVDELDALIEDPGLPLIVKHPNSYASTGMTRNSRVETPQKLREQVKRICHRFGSARVEEFVDGPEFTALIVDNPDDLADPFVYPPAELILPPGEDFLHAQVKWKEWVYLKPVEDKKLARRLKDMMRKLYLAMNGVGYARGDIRMGQDGQLYMIEINPNCGILFKPEDLGPADVMMEYDAGGHAGFLDRLFRSALVRQQGSSATSAEIAPNSAGRPAPVKNTTN